MDPKRLRIWTGAVLDEGPPKLNLSQTLYAPPNPDHSRKQCLNCIFWLGGRGPMGTEGGDGATGGREECFIHDADVIVLPDMVCGYHVFGVSLGGSVGAFRENMQPVTPELSGLEQVKGGSSCDSCRHFAGTPETPSGLCQALYETELDELGEPMHAVVQSQGCCCAWERKA